MQSSRSLLLAAPGPIPTFDAAIFADTGWQPAAVHTTNLDRLSALGHRRQRNPPPRDVLVLHPEDQHQARVIDADLIRCKQPILTTDHEGQAWTRTAGQSP